MSIFDNDLDGITKANCLRILSLVTTSPASEFTDAMRAHAVFPAHWLRHRMNSSPPFNELETDMRYERVSDVIRIMLQSGVLISLSHQESREQFDHIIKEKGALLRIVSLDKLLPTLSRTTMVAMPAYVPEKAPARTPVTHWRKITGHEGFEAGYTDTMQLIDGAIRPVAEKATAAA